MTKTLRELKPNEYFTIREIAEPTQAQVWVKGAYDRSTKTFSCSNFDDMNRYRDFKPDRLVYTDFTF